MKLSLKLEKIHIINKNNIVFFALVCELLYIVILLQGYEMHIFRYIICKLP